MGQQKYESFFNLCNSYWQENIWKLIEEVCEQIAFNFEIEIFLVNSDDRVAYFDTHQTSPRRISVISW
jgi:hypothetical protein